jgi:hypothetical protein
MVGGAARISTKEEQSLPGIVPAYTIVVNDAHA